MTGDLGTTLLAEVSRSFYLTLRLLPRPMQRAASLAYLLARTSDTVSDMAAAPVDLRTECLSRFRSSVAFGGGAPRWPVALINACADPAERRLLERAGDVRAAVAGLPEAEAVLVREVVDIIIGGQQLDLERFGDATAERPVALKDEEALEDYAWRVAGCVGAFWTKLGFLTIGPDYSSAPQEELKPRGIEFGKGLQLVNILRDLPRDLAEGRCYLPVQDPRDRKELLDCHQVWVARAKTWVAEGKVYAETLRSRRLRAAVALPALLAEETLAPLEDVTWERLEQRVKVPRSRVYQLLLKSLR